ncbi:unnamed protein product [Spirodela intermedia]|uniref:Uncharacterized protein n=1 Tax=Spirodela intermedia TaxID=51605 RepID=A0A7I8J846_SPIIN|nr:unnamed protein product [Spirodela intermedia]CAA6665915.1 unnamed protein product [Spirodela intermedia]
MDPSQTRRVVLLVDLHPLLTIQDPAQYAAAVLAAARRLLAFHPLSDTLFACKPFFSSLSPLLSTSWIHRLFGKSAAFLSFDRPSGTLESLSLILSSVSSNSSACDGDIIGHLGLPRASLMSESLFQLAYDCTWEPRADSSTGKNGISPVRSNMIVIVDDKIMSNINEFQAKFISSFCSVNELFISRDVHFTWLHVDLDSEQFVEAPHKQFIEKGIRDVGWSLCSTDAVALGAVFIPFGLIYPYIGHQLPSDCVDALRRGRAELSLEVSDVCGKPLECKCCDLEVLILGLQREMEGILDLFSQDSRDIARIQLKDVLRVNDQSKVQSQMHPALLLREFPGESRIENFTEVIHEKADIWGAAVAGKPIWQLLLAFLHRRRYCAFVSVNRGNGHSLLGIMMPFTVHSAIMYIVDYSNVDSRTPKLNDWMNLLSVLPPEPARDKNHRKKRNKFLSMLHDLSYDCFRKHVFGQNGDDNFEVGLEDLYFDNGCDNSKKLRFFQCWMKQFKKCNYSFSKVSDPEVFSDPKEVTSERSASSHHETTVLVSPLPSTEETHQFADMNEEYSSYVSLQSLESFSETVSQKIERILSSEKADLSLLAERVVKLAVHYFFVKFGADGSEDPVSIGDDCTAVVAAEVSKLLLKRPKVIAAKYRSSNAPPLPSWPAVPDDVKKVREHELQILFRMEILQSEVSSSIDDNAKLKFVKDICLLLENIEFNLQGSVFTGESLIDFAGRTIKARRGRNHWKSLPRRTISTDNSSQSHENCGNTAPDSAESTETSVLMKALERRERARRFSHFTSWRQNLQRVWAPKQARKGKPTVEPSHRSSKKRRRHLSRKDTVCETPMCVLGVIRYDRTTAAEEPTHDLAFLRFPRLYLPARIIQNRRDRLQKMQAESAIKVICWSSSSPSQQVGIWPIRLRPFMKKRHLDIGALRKEGGHGSILVLLAMINPGFGHITRGPKRLFLMQHAGPIFSINLKPL